MYTHTHTHTQTQQSDIIQLKIYRIKQTYSIVKSSYLSTCDREVSEHTVLLILVSRVHLETLSNTAALSILVIIHVKCTNYRKSTFPLVKSHSLSVLWDKYNTHHCISHVYTQSVCVPNVYAGTLMYASLTCQELLLECIFHWERISHRTLEGSHHLQQQHEGYS